MDSLPPSRRAFHRGAIRPSFDRRLPSSGKVEIRPGVGMSPMRPPASPPMRVDSRPARIYATTPAREDTQEPHALYSHPQEQARLHDSPVRQPKGESPGRLARFNSLSSDAKSKKEPARVEPPAIDLPRLVGATSLGPWTVQMATVGSSTGVVQPIVAAHAPSFSTVSPTPAHASPKRQDDVPNGIRRDDGTTLWIVSPSRDRDTRNARTLQTRSIELSRTGVIPHWATPQRPRQTRSSEPSMDSPVRHTVRTSQTSHASTLMRSPASANIRRPAAASMVRSSHSVGDSIHAVVAPCPFQDSKDQVSCRTLPRFSHPQFSRNLLFFCLSPPCSSTAGSVTCDRRRPGCPHSQQTSLARAAR